jgi:hypothetical protein
MRIPVTDTVEMSSAVHKLAITVLAVREVGLWEVTVCERSVDGFRVL